MSEERGTNLDEVWLAVEGVGDLTLADCVGPKGDHVFQLTADEFPNLHLFYDKSRLQNSSDTGQRDIHPYQLLLRSLQLSHQSHARSPSRKMSPESAVQALLSWKRSAGRDTASHPS